MDTDDAWFRAGTTAIRGPSLGHKQDGNQSRRQQQAPKQSRVSKEGVHGGEPGMRVVG